MHQNSDLLRAFERFLTDTGCEGNFELLRTDSGGESTSRSFAARFDCNRIGGEFNTNIPALNGLL